MISSLKLLMLTILVGTSDAYWGHTFMAESNGKVYALRSLADSSSLCVFDAEVLKEREGIIELSSLKVPMQESVTEGKNSCHITLLPRQAAVSDYSSGTLSLYPLDKDGSVEGRPQMLRFSGSSIHPTRQKAPHIHSSALSPDGELLVVVDLGTDRIYRFAVEGGRVSDRAISPVVLPAGCGPRHSAFSADGSYLYVVTELSDEVLVYDTATFNLQYRYTLSGENSEGGAHIALSADGKYLYASQRVSSTGKSDICGAKDGVAIYKCLKGGKLKKLHYQPTGGHPRHFALSADGRALVVACRDSDSVEVYPLKGKSGVPTGEVERFAVPAPVYIGLR